MTQKISTFAKTAFAVAALSFGFGASVQAETIYFATSADQAPYNTLDRDGSVQGFEAEVQNLICARANLICDWALAPTDELIQQLDQQEYDVIMSAYQITDDRKNYISFSAPYLTNMPSAILVLSGAGMPAAGQSAGGISGSLQEKLVTSQGWSLNSYDRVRDALAALDAGEIVAFMTDQASAKRLVQDHSDLYAIAAAGIKTEGGIALGLRPSDTGLLDTLNAAIASLKSDGSLAALKATWFGATDKTSPNGD